MFTVGELKKFLESFDEDTVVFFNNQCFSDWSDNTYYIKDDKQVRILNISLSDVIDDSIKWVIDQYNKKTKMSASYYIDSFNTKYNYIPTDRITKRLNKHFKELQEFFNKRNEEQDNESSNLLSWSLEYEFKNLIYYILKGENNGC